MSSVSNPYSAPDADLAVKSSGSGIDSIKEIPRFTAWAVFGLSLITFGIYSYYWLYSRTTQLNNMSAPENRVASWLPITAVSLIAVSWILSFAPLASADLATSTAFSGISAIISIVYIVFYIMWIFAFRKALHALSGANKGDMFWLGGIMTFFFNTIYFQYKINQIHDNS